MKRPKGIVWHCSADREGSYEGKDLDYYDRMHRNRKPPFRKIGYHIVIFADGSWEFGRLFNESGAHARGYNSTYLGIMYQGGLDVNGKPKDTRTPSQMKAIKDIKSIIDYIFPGLDHVGHRDLSVDLNGDGVISKNEWMKACPCFDVKTELIQKHGIF